MRTAARTRRGAGRPTSAVSLSIGAVLGEGGLCCQRLGYWRVMEAMDAVLLLVRGLAGHQVSLNRITATDAYYESTVSGE